MPVVGLAGQSPGGDADVEVGRVLGDGLQQVEHVQPHGQSGVIGAGQLQVAARPQVVPPQHVPGEERLEIRCVADLVPRFLGGFGDGPIP